MLKIRYYAPLAAALIFILLLSFQAWQINNLLQKREWIYSENLLRDTSSKTQGQIIRFTENNDLQSIRALMSELYLYRRDTQAFLINDSKILAANTPGYEGRNIGDISFNLDKKLIKKAYLTQQGVVVRNKENKSLTSYFPIPIYHFSNSTSTANVSHGPMLVVHVELDSAFKRRQNEIIKALSVSALALIFATIFLSIVIYFAFTKRVETLLQIIRRYMNGESEIRTAYRFKDEIADIGIEFNNLADFLDAKQSEIQALNQTLEARVEKRTEQMRKEIKERLNAQRALEASQTELVSILDLAPDGIVVIDRAGTIARFNRAAEKMFGWDAEEVIGQNIKLLVPSPYHEEHDGYLANYKKDKISSVVGQNRELSGRCKDGSLLPIELSVSLIILNGKEVFIGVLRNIKARKATEQQLESARMSLIQSEKMAALGNLVAGVAHEINTPVGIGVTAITHLREVAEQFNEIYKNGSMKRKDLDHFLNVSLSSANIIETNLARASELVRSFKGIAVDQSSEDIREISLNDYVNQIIMSLRPKMKNRPIEIQVDIAPDLKARINSGAFSQIVTNLIINSLTHAFDNEDEGHIIIEMKADNRDVLLYYQDDGKGMDALTISKIFDPFFTTKRGQGGSGLGMHIVYNIVTQTMGGSIKCASTPGQGVFFTVRIPQCIYIQES